MEIENTLNRIKVLQVNLQRGQIQTIECVNYSMKNNIDIVMVNDSYSFDYEVKGFPLTWRRVHGKAEIIKAAIIIVNKNLTIFELSHINDQTTCWIVISFGSEKFALCSTYLSPSHPSDLQNKLIELKTVKPNMNYLISTDSNAKSTLWSSPITDERGHIMTEFLFSENLYLLNNSDKPTCITHRGRSFIDLTMATEKLAEKITDWRVDDGKSFSDHEYIRFDITSINMIQNEVKPIELSKDVSSIIINEHKYLIKNAKWDGLRADIAKEIQELEISSNLDTIEGSYEINKLVLNMTNLIIKCCEKNLMIRTNFNKKSVTWWTEELTNLRYKVRNCRRRYQRTKTIGLKKLIQVEFLKLNRQNKELVLKQKKVSWRTFTSNSNTWDLPYKLVTNKLKISKPMAFIKKSDGSYTSSAEETMKYLIDEVFPDDNIQDDDEWQNEIRRDVISIDTTNDVPITLYEIQDAIETQNPNKAPGWDMINSEVIKKVFECVPNTILKLFNCCLRNGCYPIVWKAALLILSALNYQYKFLIILA